MVSRVAEHGCRGRQGGLPLMGTLLMVCGLTTGLARSLTAAEVDYTRDVKPLLQQHCVGCHGAKRQRGDLRLDSRAALLKGGSRGPAVVVGKAAESLLIQAVLQDDPEIAMPPEGEPLSSEEVQVLRDWIDQGAPGPADEATARKELPWSFRPVQRPHLPAAAASIDELLEAQRARQDLASLGFSAEADRVTQIRRLYLVMHGLPPTPAEVREFAADTAPGAYERLVDRVLASPRYGERWGRHWLDIARFAESNGFETNRVRPNAWPYRDYVIEAFNKDKPYDQFIREQVAGDALRADAGTGFLVAGAYDLVKSPDVNLTLMQRQDELADIINTTGTAFLGLTLGCARCHDHKFDPVSQRDYYALQGVFAGVNFAPRPLPRDRTEESDREVARLRAQVQQNEERLAVLRSKAAGQPNPAGKLRPAVNARLNEETIPPIQTTALRFTIRATNASEPCLDELEVYDAAGKNVALASAGAKPSASGTLPGHEIHKLEHVNDGQLGNNRSWISNTSGKGWVRIDFPAAVTIAKVVWGRDRNQQFQDRVATDYSVEVLQEGDTWREVASAADREKFGPEDPRAFLKRLSAEEATEGGRLLDQVADARRRIGELTEGLNAWLGTFSQPPEIRRLHRGDHTLPREVVPPGGLEVFGGLSLDPNEPEQQRRLKLANWLASRENPLTPRVMVNRIWHYIFGTGLVETPSDFGGNGVPPTHPELLDWLADEFVQSGWSVKHIQRLILTTRAFRQSSAPRAEGLRADAAARLLWRFPPRRLEAEAIRDCILASSGVLDLSMGGPGFFLQKVEVDNVYRYFPKEEFGPPEFRRMVYLNRIRQEQDPVFGSFDCPSGNQVTPKRPRSNTPLQALNLFNSPFILQQAGLLAGRLKKEAGEDVAAQVRLAFQWTVARVPDDFEQQASQEMIREHGLEAFCRALFNTSEFLFLF